MIVDRNNRCAHISSYMSNSGTSKRKAKITEIHVAEARRLKQLWDERASLSQEAFGAQYGIGTQGAVWQYLNHRTPLNIKAAMAFAEHIECDVGEFSPRLKTQIDAIIGDAADEGEFADIPRLSVSASAGPGHENHLEEVIGSLKFRREFLRDVGVNPEHGAIINVKGASMEPVIAHGAVLLVNRANREPRAGKIYVFLRRGELIVKKAVKDGAGNWLARSENDDRTSYPDFPFTDGDQLVGRAVWVGAKL